jgi:hypothetical protein
MTTFELTTAPILSLGNHFYLSNPLSPVQQKERHAVCSCPSDETAVAFYPLLICNDIETLSRKCLVEVNWAVQDLPSVFSGNSFSTLWISTRGPALELHMQTPWMLSTRIDRTLGIDSTFAFDIRIYRYNPTDDRYDFFDRLTTNKFRTVSHSKLTSCSRQLTRQERKMKNLVSRCAYGRKIKE